MIKIVNAKVQLENGQEIREDVYGNNFAILYPNCNLFPILFVALNNYLEQSNELYEYL